MGFIPREYINWSNVWLQCNLTPLDKSIPNAWMLMKQKNEGLMET